MNDPPLFVKVFCWVSYAAVTIYVICYPLIVYGRKDND